MVKADWGLHRHAPHLSGPRGSCEPVDSDDPATVPEARAARDQGYEPAPEAPLWCFLPAIWPDHARAWVRDTRARHATVSCDGEPARRVPWSAADYAEIESDTNALLVECGLPPRPAGRLWLLQPPAGFSSLDAVLGHLLAAATAAGEEVMASACFVAAVDQELRSLFADDG